MTNARRTIVQASGISKYYPIKGGVLKRTVGHVKAVDNVNLSIQEGETFGLVGESGCGKSTLGRCLIRAIEPSAGTVRFQERDGSMIDVTKLGVSRLRASRRDMQLVFQDPYSSLNPRMTVFEIIAEPLLCNKMLKGEALRNRVHELAERVGLSRSHLGRYPHAFSGGQRQRVGIARALATNPRFIVCDEAVSALDVSVQAQILNLLDDLQQELGLTYLFISHDLGVIRHICDRVGVMYVGHIVESAPTSGLFTRPRHPYTEALLASRPIPNPRLRGRRTVLPGEVPNPADPPAGCHFHPRCPYARDVCRSEKPPLTEVAEGHFAACHFADTLELKGDLSASHANVQ